jgi:hypothetical protein
VRGGSIPLIEVVYCAGVLGVEAKPDLEFNENEMRMK